MGSTHADSVCYTFCSRGPMTPKTEVTQTTDTDREELGPLHKAYDAARHRALARLRKGYELRFTPPRSRDDLHER